MQYCEKCGAPVAPEAQFCSACGCARQQPYNTCAGTYATLQTSKKTNALALAGFITAVVSLLINLWGIIGLVALVLSIVGYHQIKETNENGKGLAIAGIIIGALSVLYGVVAIFLVDIFADVILSLLFY